MSKWVFSSMWRHIGDNPRYVLLDERGSSNTKENESEESSHNQSADIRRPLDWSSSSFGLFTGLLSLVALIINLIVYFALVNQVSRIMYVIHPTITTMYSFPVGTIFRFKIPPPILNFLIRRTTLGWAFWSIT